MIPTKVEPHEPDAREQVMRWLGFLKRASRFWLLPLGAVLIGSLASSAYLYLKQPTYRSETVILYVEKGSPGDVSEPASAPGSVTVRLKELLMSRPKLERVVSEYGLYPDLRRAHGTIDAVEELKKHIDFRSPGGDTFSIAFEGSSPSQAQRVTAELGRLVIDGDSSLRTGRARVALAFLVGEKQGTESQLRDAEQKLASFMAQHPRFALDATPLTNGAAIRASLGGPSGQTTGEFSRQPARAGSVSTAGRPLAPAPSHLPRSADPGSVSDAETEGARASAALAAARENLAQQLTHYTPAHPDVRAAQAAVERATERLAAAPRGGPSTERVADPVGVRQPAVPFRGTATVAPRLGSGAVPAVRPGGRTEDVVELETQWFKLTRAVTEARQRQDQVEAQLFKADILASSEGGGHGVQVNVIDPAFLPQRPLPPGRAAIVSMFLAVALAIGMLGALVRAALDDRLFGARDAAGIAEVLVEVPRVSTERRAHAAS